MVTCKVCDENAADFHRCGTCNLYCCSQCSRAHIGLCKYLKDTKCNMCQYHHQQVDKFCFNCCELICPECVKRGHRQHTILHFVEAFENIKSGLPNEEMVLAEKEAICIQNLETYKKIQHNYEDIVRRVKEEKMKWTTLISDISHNLIPPLNTNLELIATKREGVKITSHMIQDTKTKIRDLETTTFPLIFLSKWSDAFQFKQKLLHRLIEQSINEKIIERSELEKRRDMPLEFQNLVLNSAMVKDSKCEIDDMPAAHLHEQLSLKDRPSKTVSDQRFQGVVNDIQGNAEHVKEKECNEIRKTKQQAIELKPNIDIFGKEVSDFMAENEKIEEEIREYKEENEYMYEMLKFLPKTLLDIDQRINTSDLKDIKLPARDNDFMNKCTAAIEAILTSYMKMKKALLVANLELKDNCGRFEKLKKKLDIYTNDIELKMSAIEKLTSRNADLLKQNRTLEQQLYDLQISNKNVVEEKDKHKNENIDLQKSLENQKSILVARDSIIEKLNSSIVMLKSEIRNKDEKMQSLTKEKDRIKTKALNLHEDCMKNKKDLESTKHRLLHIQSNNFNLEKDIQVLRREKDDLQTRLSSVAGEKLTKGNPSITDLGDPNRPMKIGEKYGELYDNEWTDAMENVQNVKKYYGDLKDVEMEEILIRHLHRLLKCCYTDCFEMSVGQLQKLGVTFAETMCMSPMSKEEIVNLPVCREASIHRRANSEAFAKYLYEEKIVCKNILNGWDYHYQHEQIIQLLMETTFFEKCVYLCWSMAIQEPVMYLDDDLKEGIPLDKNTYKEFVKSGDTVVYVVWPALFLHRNGPLLYKGVAQASWKKAEQFV
ncbi:unnamed protein product [Mytilus edulis]|uniref:B box-type domain-containing protein n=1 Tax=Mytilus edulis TaxID=6550 RepID=A0A8S3V8K3_MYTED|nr:unnamed protein product [Mytilus edulis]